MFAYSRIRAAGWLGCLAVGLASASACQAAGAVVPPLERPATVLAGERARQVAFQSLALADRQVFAVGERGIALYSDDAGKTWRQGQVPVSVTLTAVSMLTPQVGWAVGHGGVVLRTEDGGRNWSRQLDGFAAIRLLQDAAAAEVDVALRERRTALAQRLAEEGADKPLFAVHALDRQTVVVVGAFNTAFVSRDGGRQWSSLADQLPNPREGHWYAVAGGGQRFYIAGEFGLLLGSQDAGRSFERVTLPYEGSLFALAEDGRRLVVGGLRGNAFVSEDGGRNWRPVTGLGEASITAIRTERDGSFLIGDQAGALWRLAAEGARAERLPAPVLPPVTDLARTPDGAVVVSSVAGVIRLGDTTGERTK